ncbi:uncharacterized protein BT62DRAFT_1007136 [Guyanagaster necrorhizus]|uniref:Uncharacterized protein n=1 Tax=Guyanagaster necrorhizus TaxID=856835 RepID=A0A9P8ARS3_9AGAR|nr:uncharacterized protein BT62DRAFT_1007136 [Guyanagaster necrorhizus MCA 3950]KAG7445400.1 hypothetical protein BT62DRAFT_1007136 [Guyanagaster necrorhizus MCA 3950]
MTRRSSSKQGYIYIFREGRPVLHRPREMYSVTLPSIERYATRPSRDQSYRRQSSVSGVTPSSLHVVSGVEVKIVIAYHTESRTTSFGDLYIKTVYPSSLESEGRTPRVAGHTASSSKYIVVYQFHSTNAIVRRDPQRQKARRCRASLFKASAVILRRVQ